MAQADVITVMMPVTGQTDSYHLAALDYSAGLAPVMMSASLGQCALRQYVGRILGQPLLLASNGAVP